VVQYHRPFLYGDPTNPGDYDMASSNKTVTVGCKLPHGQHLRLGERRITLNGQNTEGFVAPGGYGLTTIDADDWAALQKKYAGDPAFINELIFAEETKVKAEKKAEKNADKATGLEQIDPNKLPPGNGDIKPLDNKD
jgi:hypothetical protein